jgi:nucleotide-binding universal stress UspA family protein
MKTILVPVERHDLTEPTLQTTLVLAQTFGSYVEGFALGPALNPFLATDAIGAMVVYDADPMQDPETLNATRRAFENFMRAHGVPSSAPLGEGPSYGWSEGGVAGETFIGSRGRVFDVTVVGRPTTKAEGPRMSTLEAALFETGRPVLIAPPSAPAMFGESVMIAWNRSTETARAIGFAMPLLKRARQVTVLTVEDAGVPGPTGREVVTYLERHGIASRGLSVKRGAQPPGEVILAEAARLGCDLLIKGAFTQSRLRQMIFGGATRHVIAEATLPVFMAH